MKTFCHACGRLTDKIVQTFLQQPRPKPKRPYSSSPEPGVEQKDQVSPATQLQKRQIVGDRDDNERQPKRARLTRKYWALFNEMAKTKGINKTSASAPPESSIVSITTKTTSTTSSSFAIRAYKNGILELRYSKPPTNLKEIHEGHAKSRATA